MGILLLLQSAGNPCHQDTCNTQSNFEFCLTLSVVKVKSGYIMNHSCLIRIVYIN